MRTARHLAVLLACACLPATAYGAPAVRLQATLTPEVLGHGTTIGLGFQIITPTGEAPPALAGMDLRYPDNFGIALSGLGIETCAVAVLEAAGPVGCPRDSLMGFGSALAEIPVGSQIVDETAEIKILRGPTEDGHLALLIHTNGRHPVSAQLVFPALLLPSSPPFGGSLDVNVPPIPSIPGAPDVAIARLQTTLGPQGITYTERVGDTLVAYRPKGILLPDSCPRGGFPFAVQLSFQNGSHASAHTVVPCPGRAQLR